MENDGNIDDERNTEMKNFALEMFQTLEDAFTAASQKLKSSVDFFKQSRNVMLKNVRLGKLTFAEFLDILQAVENFTKYIVGYQLLIYSQLLNLQRMMNSTGGAINEMVLENMKKVLITFNLVKVDMENRLNAIEKIIEDMKKLPGMKKN